MDELTGRIDRFQESFQGIEEASAGFGRAKQEISDQVGTSVHNIDRIVDFMASSKNQYDTVFFCIEAVAKEIAEK